MNKKKLDISYLIKKLDIQKEAVSSLSTLIQSQAFAKTVEFFAQISCGRVLLTGVGKSGYIARKIASTLSSIGTPSFFLHPTEASHGDIGCCTKEDCVLALSWSGWTQELKDIIAHCIKNSILLVGMTNNHQGYLAQNANLVLLLPDVEEMCPHSLVPTTSTTIQLIAGDLIAVALMQICAFTSDSFKENHPGGSLGSHLRQAQDIMHTGVAIPLVHQKTKTSDAIIQMSAYGFGCIGVVNQDTQLIGVITDGDLRRHMPDDNILHKNVTDIMTHDPKTVYPSMRIKDIVSMMHIKKITSIFVIDQQYRPIGFLHMHDLLKYY